MFDMYSLYSPLYILYSQVSAFSEAYDGELCTGGNDALIVCCIIVATSMKVSIQGDEEEAQSFVEQRPIDSGHQSDDDSDSDMDTKEEDSRRVCTMLMYLVIFLIFSTEESV